MHIQPFQAVYPDMGLISSPDHFFSTVKEKFHEYWESGFYQHLPKEGIYLHKIEAAHRSYTGLIACVDIQDYLDGDIKRHENTLAASEQEQVNLMLHRSSQVKPVMLAYQGVDEIGEICRTFVQENPAFLTTFFESSGEAHHFWKIMDEQLIRRLQAVFQEKVPAAYISDGHHRTSATALLFQRSAKASGENPFRWMPCAFYSTSELEIFDFNRIVEGLSDFSPVAFMAKLSQLFDIKLMGKAGKPAQKHELTLFLENEWFNIRWRKEVLEKYADQPVILDVSLLNELVLKELLDISDVRTDSRVKYHQGTKELDILKEKTLKGDQRLAFCLYPVSLEDFFLVSDIGGVLPPKSTWFEPRIRSGLIVRRFQV